MVCKELTDILLEYFEGTLDPEVHKDLEDHFKDCPPCMAFLNTYKKTPDLCRKSIGQIDIPPALEEKLRVFLRDKLKKKI